MRTLLSLYLWFAAFPVLALPAQAQQAAPAPETKGSTATQQQETGRVIEFSAYVKEILAGLSPEKRGEVIAHYAKHGYYVDTPDLWQILGEQEPQVVWQAVNHFGEPLTVPMLDALERMFSKIPMQIGWHNTRIRVAALLYRYNRPIGRAYLEKILKNNVNTEAAVVFAVNHEKSLAKYIFSVLFRAIESRSEDSFAVTEALADWRQPEIAAVLLKALQRDPGHVSYSVALANQEVAAAVPLIRKQYKTIPADNPARIRVAAALVKLRVAESPQLMNYLLGQLKSPTSGRAMKFSVIHVFGLVREKKSIPVLQGLIRRYIQTRPAPKPPALGGTDLTLPEDQKAVLAAEALARIKDPSARVLIASLLARLKEDQAPYGLWVRAARALLDLDASHQRSVTVIQSVLGETWIARERKLRALRPLPTFLLLDDPEHAEAQSRDVGEAERLTGWTPRVGFIEFPRDLQARDARDEDMRGLWSPGLLSPLNA